MAQLSKKIEKKTHIKIFFDKREGHENFLALFPTVDDILILIIDNTVNFLEISGISVLVGWPHRKISTF
jgi:hypothetical protein